MNERWDSERLLASTAYGYLYLVTKVDAHIHARRIRTKKAKLCVTDEKQLFTKPRVGQLLPGHLLFFEKDRANYTAFTPDEGGLKSGIEYALKKLRGKS